MQINLKEFFQFNKDLAGVIDGERAFCGPELLQIDPTNSCNNNCIACWCRSPLLGDKAISREKRDQFLPLKLIQQVLDDCAAMGTTNIYIAGGGEPFMHPNIIEIIAHIKTLGMACHINTNFTLVDQETATELVHMGVDHLIVSLWAATPKTYVTCHPNKNQETFKQLINVLNYLIELKKNGPPHVKLYNVIMNRNFHEIAEMVDLAHDLHADCAEFTVADVIPGYTDTLLLSDDQRQQIVDVCDKIANKPGPKDSHTEIYMNEFRRRVAETGAKTGEYDKLMLIDMPCLIGWNFARILADGNVNGCLKAHRIPVGNIYKSSFAQIWNGSRQKEFRRKTGSGDPADPFFSFIGNDDGSGKIGCHRGCDDIERNRRLWNRFNQLTFAESLWLKSAGYFYRAKNFLTPERKNTLR